MLVITEKQQKTISNFSLESLNLTEKYKQLNLKKYRIYQMKQVILNF